MRSPKVICDHVLSWWQLMTYDFVIVDRCVSPYSHLLAENRAIFILVLYWWPSLRLNLMEFRTEIRSLKTRMMGKEFP